nr:hypothetical protein [Tanacetum cinerariifolium]
MTPLTFADTHNRVVFLSKSDTSEGFEQIMDFLNAHTIQYALVVNPTIYVSCIKRFWATTTIKKVNDIVQLRALIDGKKVVVLEAIIRRDLHLDDADGVKCSSNEEIFRRLHVLCLSAKRTLWNEFSCFMASAVICLATDDMTSHNTRYTSPALTQKVFANMRRVGKGFSGVETPLFASMLDPTPTPHATPPQDQPSTPHASPPQEQPTTTSESSMSLLTTLMETCATLSQKFSSLGDSTTKEEVEDLMLLVQVKAVR